MDLNSFWIVFTLLYFGKALNKTETIEGVFLVFFFFSPGFGNDHCVALQS